MKQSYVAPLVLLSVLVIFLGFLKFKDTNFLSVLEKSETTPPENSQEHSIVSTDDKSFYEHMIPHHDEAIDVTLYTMNYVQDPDLKQFMSTVIAVQATQSEKMKKSYNARFGYPSTPLPSYVPMMRDLTKLTGKEMEKQYIQDMIPHHEAAVKMAETVLATTTDSEVKEYAQDIARDQTSEIELLKKWLVEKYE